LKKLRGETRGLSLNLVESVKGAVRGIKFVKLLETDGDNRGNATRIVSISADAFLENLLEAEEYRSK